MEKMVAGQLSWQLENAQQVKKNTEWLQESPFNWRLDT